MTSFGKAALLLTAAGFFTLASAATVDLNAMTRNGDAAMSGATLRLTPAQNSRTGSAFIGAPVTVADGMQFLASFELYIHGGSGADGMTFVVQNSGAADTAIGGGGGDLGYGGIGNSLAVEFDTYGNGVNATYNDPNDNHAGIDANGSLASLSLYTPAWDLEDDTNHIYAWVEYNTVSEQLDVYVNNAAVKPATPQMSETIDLAATLGGTQAYFGFTAATGGSNNYHDVISFDLTVKSAYEIPAVGTAGKAALALLMALGSAFFYRRRKESGIA